MKKRLVPALLLPPLLLGVWITWGDTSVVETPSQAEEFSLNPEVIGPPIPEQHRVQRLEGKFPERSNLRDVLSPQGFSPQDIHRLIEQTRQVYDLNRVSAGHAYALENFLDGRFRKLEYQIDETSTLVVLREGDAYVAELKERILETRVERIDGRISESLWASLVDRGENPQLVMSVHELMQWDIDFTSIQPEDTFLIVVEKQYYRDGFVRYGNIQAMKFIHGGRPFHAFLFSDPESGKPRYFDLDGNSVRKAFLKVPLKYDYRISSGFSSSRLHPVTGRRRPHYGVDYAAPVGTPVLASASGRVVAAGWNGAGGRTVKLRHPNGYITSYLHLSKILVKAGASVAQGDRIGLVGATGVVTGPHLDYRIQDRQGRYLNPRKYVALPSDTAVPAGQMDQFEAIRDAFLRDIEEYALPDPSNEGIAFAG